MRRDNTRLATELADLRIRYGVGLDSLTADEIASFVDCCRAIDNPYGEVGLTLSELPVARVGGVYFYPLTVGATVWLAEYADKWWRNDATSYFWALCYALIHGHEREAFAELTNIGDARKAILRTCIRFVFTRRALEQAVDKALGRVGMFDATDKKQEEEVQTDWVAFIARLETQTGIKKDEWLWGRSANYVIRAYHDLHAFSASFAANGVKARVFDALDKALTNLAVLKKSIKDRLERAKAEPEEKTNG